MFLLYVIIIVSGLAALYFIGIVLLVGAAFIVQSYQLATGKITRAQLDEMAAARKAKQKKHKRGGFFSGSGLPFTYMSGTGL